MYSISFANDPAFVSELDFVMTLDGHLIGQNMFMSGLIVADDGRSIPITDYGTDLYCTGA